MILNSSSGSNMQSFESKRKLLFDCLNDAEKDLKGTNLDQSNAKIEDLEKCDRNYSSTQNKKVSKYHGKESIFKKPELSLTKCLKPKKTPDYQIHPHKWKKYSLSDVDISDKTNTAAAFAFLKDIEIQKEQNAANSSSSSSTKISKPVFNKSISLKRNLKECLNTKDTDEDDKPILKGSKLIMPEYKFGKKKNINNKEKLHTLISSSKATDKNEEPVKKSAKQLRLAHLEDDEYDINDNDDDDN